MPITKNLYIPLDLLDVASRPRELRRGEVAGRKQVRRVPAQEVGEADGLTNVALGRRGRMRARVLEQAQAGTQGAAVEPEDVLGPDDQLHLGRFRVVGQRGEYCCLRVRVLARPARVDEERRLGEMRVPQRELHDGLQLCEILLRSGLWR